MVIKYIMEQPKNQRIALLLAEDEVKAVDEWRFANKIASRNEAIRQLVALGLKSAGKEKGADG